MVLDELLKKSVFITCTFIFLFLKFEFFSLCTEHGIKKPR